MNIKAGSYWLVILISLPHQPFIHLKPVKQFKYIILLLIRAYLIYMQGKIPFNAVAHKEKLLQKIQNIATDIQVKTYLETGINVFCDQLTSVQKQVIQKDQQIKKLRLLLKAQKDINSELNSILDERKIQDTEDFKKRLSEKRMQKHNSLEDQIRESRKGVQVFSETYQFLHDKGCENFTNLFGNLGQFQQLLSNLKKIKPKIQIMFREEAPQAGDIFTQIEKNQMKKQNPQSLLQDRLSDIFMKILKETEHLVHNKKESSQSTFSLLKRSYKKRSQSYQDLSRIQRNHSLDLKRLNSQAHNLREMHYRSQR